jgi:RNA polymerase sigma-70 factor (ECF subfamily)
VNPERTAGGRVFRAALPDAETRVWKALWKQPSRGWYTRALRAQVGEFKVVDMAELSPPEVTQLLQAWSRGESSALKTLTPLVYKELHRLAHRYMGFENPGHTLQTTALVNEAYLRLVSNHANWQNRAHFFAISAQLMRQILVDFARSRHQWKRGGKVQRVSLDEALIGSPERDEDLVALDDALTALTSVDPRKSRVVELRFFGGLSVEETAEVLKVSTDTVLRDWRLAKMWLLREMSHRDRPEGN